MVNEDKYGLSQGFMLEGIARYLKPLHGPFSLSNANFSMKGLFVCKKQGWIIYCSSDKDGHVSVFFKTFLFASLEKAPQ